MNKKLIRLTESDLHRIVRESVNKILNEIGDTPRGQYALGQVSQRANTDSLNAEDWYRQTHDDNAYQLMNKRRGVAQRAYDTAYNKWDKNPQNRTYTVNPSFTKGEEDMRGKNPLITNGGYGMSKNDFNKLKNDRHMN
jgi:hypothetical protein